MPKLHFLDSGYSSNRRPPPETRFSITETGQGSHRLPEEVLQQILECAALSDKRVALGLALLSRRFQKWYELNVRNNVNYTYTRLLDCCILFLLLPNFDAWPA